MTSKTPTVRSSPEASSPYLEKSGEIKLPLEKSGEIKLPFEKSGENKLPLEKSGEIKLPLEKSTEIPIPYKPDADVHKIKFHRFSYEETTATLHLSLENKNDFDLGLNMLQYEMWLGDDSIVNAELTDSTKIDKQGISKMQIPFTSRPKDLGSAVWDMMRGRGTGYTIKGKI